MKTFWKKKYVKSNKTKIKLDGIFSLHIRLRDTFASSTACKCISCGKIEHWTEVDCGHFVNRSHLSLRYNESNCNAQCRHCNRFDEGNNLGYAAGFLHKYGEKELDKMSYLKNTRVKISSFEYDVMIKHYFKLALARSEEIGESDVFIQKAEKTLGKKYFKEVSENCSNTSINY